MESAPAEPRNAQTATVNSQYHHFIPRLILRGFAQDSCPADNNLSATALSKKQKNKIIKSRKDGLLHFIRTQDGGLDDSLLSRHYGLTDMYRDIHALDQHDIEKRLAGLESQAGNILSKARKTFIEPGASLNLSRIEKDTLRKFLFIMKYRNSHFSSRFSVATIDEYGKGDKEKMRQYMQDRGFQSPREVWLANMRAFIDLEMDGKRKWQTEIQLRVYPDDAQLFILHVEQSYIAFCKPRAAYDEFLLTDNVFGIFEGPNSLAMNPATGELGRRIWTEWHNFAPVSASLLIILRSNLLPGNIGGETACYEKLYRALIAMHPFPDRAVSALQDLPVRRCTNSYSTIRDGKLVLNADYQGPSPTDQYTFKCFELESTHVNQINSIFLEEAVAANSVTYKSDTAIVRGVRTYLEDPSPGFKVAYGSDSAMYKYLQSLATALHALGDTASIHFETTLLPSVEQHPLDYAGHMTRWVTFCTAEEIRDRHPQLMECYRLLGGSDGNGPREQRSRWWEDVEQAGKILFLHIKIDSTLSAIAANIATKERCKRVRQVFFASLHPRYIWMYVKALRNLKNFGVNDFSQQIHPLECEGLEDDVVRKMQHLRSNDMSATLLFAAHMS